MTTEDDFQAALDARPNDWQTRLVFADWLDERDDPRAEGYRALGALQKRPHYWCSPSDGFRKSEWCWYSWQREGGAPNNRATLSAEWVHWRVLDGLAVSDRPYYSRRAAEDAAALAFGRLSKAVQTKALATQTVGAAT